MSSSTALVPFRVAFRAGKKVGWISMNSGRGQGGAAVGNEVGNEKDCGGKTSQDDKAGRERKSVRRLRSRIHHLTQGFHSIGERVQAHEDADPALRAGDGEQRA